MFEPGEDEREAIGDTAPPAHISRELFLQWREIRRGSQPAEDMTNPVGQWLIDSNIPASFPSDDFGCGDLVWGTTPSEGCEGKYSPGWCYNRFGRTLTSLPDGRKIIIAGEHEGGYDPDFAIYNDVVVVEANGTYKILGYPENHFPPTDFHTATLIGSKIVLIGNLGYPETRKPGTTQVLELDLQSMLFHLVTTTGECPGWISCHETQFNSDSGTFLVSGGKIDLGEDYVENFDDWKLDMATWNWSRVTHRPVVRWTFRREDGRPIWLDAMRSGRYTELRKKAVSYDEYATTRPEKIDQEILNTVYDPPGDFVPPEDPLHAYRSTFSYLVQETEVTFEERSRWIVMTVKGNLPEDLIKSHVRLIIERLSQLEGTACTAREIVTP